jgi:hypothetical protein
MVMNSMARRALKSSVGLEGESAAQLQPSGKPGAVVKEKPKDWVLLGLALVAGVLIGALFLPKTTMTYATNVTCPVCQANVSGSSGLNVIYLYPVDCPSCNTTRVNMLVSSTGVPFSAFENDVVAFPNILLTYQNISTVARASNDYNVVSSLCLAQNQIACSMKDQMASEMQACLQRNGVSLDSVVYYYADWCGTLCDNMNGPLASIEKNGSKVIRINENSTSPVKDCLDKFLNYAGGFPQFICPKTIISNTGALTSDGLERFAEDCRA